MKYHYYPGCSLEYNAAAYHVSTLAIAGALGLELLEIDDWNCCGATEYISLNLAAAYALIARNLAKAAQNKATRQVVAPCSACYLNLRKCDQSMRESPKLDKKINTALAAGGLAYQAGSLAVRHLLDVVVNDVGYAAIAAKVTRPLKGLRIAPYYGCMIVRPDFEKSREVGSGKWRVGSGEWEAVQSGASTSSARLDKSAAGQSGAAGQNTASTSLGRLDKCEYPMTLDILLKNLGAEVVEYPMKAHCCGGHMTQISEKTGFEMIRRLIKGAVEYEADLIVTLCPMCQLNLDGFQGAMNRHFKTKYSMPVLYFTQMIGLALGMNASDLGIGSELVSSRAALAKIGVEAPAAEKPAAAKKASKEALPMPKMPDPTPALPIAKTSDREGGYPTPALPIAKTGDREGGVSPARSAAPEIAKSKE